jgi:hypothetical protein
LRKVEGEIERIEQMRKSPRLGPIPGRSENVKEACRRNRENSASRKVEPALEVLRKVGSSRGMAKRRSRKVEEEIK